MIWGLPWWLWILGFLAGCWLGSTNLLRNKPSATLLNNRQMKPCVLCAQYYTRIMTTNELESLAQSIAAKTGRSVEDCRTGIRYNMAALMAKYDAKGANDYLASFGLVRLFEE